MTIADVDVINPLVENDKATAYFEDLLFQLITEVNALTVAVAAQDARITTLEAFH